MHAADRVAIFAEGDVALGYIRVQSLFRELLVKAAPEKAALVLKFLRFDHESAFEFCFPENDAHVLDNLNGPGPE